MSIKQEWVAALRSGKYKQGREKLRTDDNFCCLGVLCDIVDNTKWVAPDFKLIELFDGVGYAYKDPDQINYTTISVHDKENNCLQSKLGEMNDTGKTFDEIADWIEENVEITL